jgi:hypothetical protein
MLFARVKDMGGKDAAANKITRTTRGDAVYDRRGLLHGNSANGLLKAGRTHRVKAGGMRPLSDHQQRTLTGLL